MLRLSTATTLSARFPIVSPSGSLPYDWKESGRDDENEAGGGVARFLRLDEARYVDGGYYESSGATTIRELIRVLDREHALVDVDVIVIAIAMSERFEPSAKRELFGELLSPISAIANGQSWRAHAAIGDLGAFVKSDVPGASYYRFEVAEDRVPLPLGWYLSERARLELKGQLGIQGIVGDEFEALGKYARVCATQNAGNLGELVDRLIPPAQPN